MKFISYLYCNFWKSVYNNVRNGLWKCTRVWRRSQSLLISWCNCFPSPTSFSGSVRSVRCISNRSLWKEAFSEASCEQPPLFSHKMYGITVHLKCICPSCFCYFRKTGSPFHNFQVSKWYKTFQKWNPPGFNFYLDKLKSGGLHFLKAFYH